jgi:predicted alpha/beta hydrolase
MHPAERGSYVETGAPRPLERLYYEADDGWRAALLHLPAAPGGAGEPVILAHALGFGTDAFRYGAGPTLASRLSDAGFSVWLLAHRGDRDAVPPQKRDFCFDDVVERDLPAAIERVKAATGYPRVHFVGHGLGGQLGFAYASRGELASLVTLCAAVRFDVPRSEVMRAVLVSQLLPADWALPVRAIGPVVAPWVGDSARLRGVLHYGVEDVPVGLLRQVALWLREGALVDRTGLLDYGEALADARMPLLCAVAGDDRICPPAAALPAVERWGAEADTLVLSESWGHLDPLLATDADRAVFSPIVAWLEARRRLAWEPDAQR